MHKASGQGEKPQGDKILVVNNKFYYSYYFKSYIESFSH